MIYFGSPFLYLIYINDLPLYITAQVDRSADDTALLTISPCINLKVTLIIL